MAGFLRTNLHAITMSHDAIGVGRMRKKSASLAAGVYRVVVANGEREIRTDLMMTANRLILVSWAYLLAHIVVWACHGFEVVR